jgi:BirA family biotin operon repressor/biotin-[acetyl-CoA-carboxylase] ligase
MSHSSSLFGSHKIILSDVDSTNNFAAKLINEGLCGHGSVIMAENQSNGRGQQGAIWQSEPKLNLLFSIILCSEQLSKLKPIHINWLVSICLVDALKQFDISACIKWPNDIMVGEKKIAGMLIENKFQGSQLKQSIVGVGLNVNQLSFDISKATSMKLQTGISYTVEELLNSFILNFRKNEYLLSVDHSKSLKKRYLERLFGLNKQRFFKNESGEFEGEIIGVDDSGQLLIACQGKQKAFQNKQIQFL